MAQIGDTSYEPVAKRSTLAIRVSRPAALKLQKSFRIFPKEFCLLSGPPRSGTTVLCEWLARQPGVSAFAESRILVGIHSFLEEISRFKALHREYERLLQLARRLVLNYYSSSSILIGKRLLVDKEPLEPIAFPSRDYGEFISNVRRLFPESKLLFVIRDPVSTIWSMTRRTWGESLTNPVSRRFTLDEYRDNWCSCAKLALDYRSDPKTYIVQFGRLVNDPAKESSRILDFLKIRKGNRFEPRPTKDVGFSREEKENILGGVQSHLELLSAHGIADLK